MKTHETLAPADYERLRSGHLYRRRDLLVAQYVPEVGRVVDLGCGTGAAVATLARRYPRAELIGVDIDPAMIRYAQAQHAAPNVRYVCGDAATLAETDFDLAYGIDVLHHVRNLDAFAAAVARMVRPGGRWLVVEPNLFHPYVWLAQERMRRAGLDEDHFRPGAAERAFHGAGFAVDEKRYFSFFPGFVRRVPRRLARVESALERLPFAGGSVVYVLVRRNDGVE